MREALHTTQLKMFNRMSPENRADRAPRRPAPGSVIAVGCSFASTGSRLTKLPDHRRGMVRYSHGMVRHCHGMVRYSARPADGALLRRCVARAPAHTASNPIRVAVPSISLMRGLDVTSITV